MKLPHVRFTVRRMMVAVAMASVVFALAASLLRRSSEFRRRATLHRLAYAKIHPNTGAFPDLYLSDKELHHIDLATKYERAARYPWLPIEPDPPEPK
ncbi:hypothetical protein TA3x_003923 [Tundrisphaera sp. TA3]|uniref:hypothetical protein n=1 Tax=Tundrisphaera sp. TA3 TaxID=3435775 RepID=UPI003EBFD30C